MHDGKCDTHVYVSASLLKSNPNTLHVHTWQAAVWSSNFTKITKTGLKYLLAPLLKYTNVF